MQWTSNFGITLDKLTIIVRKSCEAANVSNRFRPWAIL